MQKRADDRSSDDGAQDAIVFVAELTTELSRIARGHGFDALAYLLDMARLEADSIRREIGPKDN